MWIIFWCLPYCVWDKSLTCLIPIPALCLISMASSCRVAGNQLIVDSLCAQGLRMETSWDRLIEKLLRKRQKILPRWPQIQVHTRRSTSSHRATCCGISNSHFQTSFCKNSTDGRRLQEVASKFRRRELSSIRKWGVLPQMFLLRLVSDAQKIALGVTGLDNGAKPSVYRKVCWEKAEQRKV